MAIYLPDEGPLVHHAVIVGMDRLRELLSLRIDWLIPRSMRFNVSFEVQHKRQAALVVAIQETQRHLRHEGWMRSILFPDIKDGVLRRALNSTIDVDPWDQQLNYEQLRAIDTIFKGKYGTLPYIITGPPSTGKTKTVVELALQILASDGSARLILCAPSDPAADTLVQRLSKQQLTPKELLRLNSPSRSFPEVPNSVLPFCFVEGDIFSLPKLSELMKKRVVVTTCRDADILRKARVCNRDLFMLEHSLLQALHPGVPPKSPPLHWTGLIIDEAAQATEPEALLPLLVVAPPKELEDIVSAPLFVMVGDQNQLGPRTAWKDPSIQKSLFERLLARPTYAEHPLARSKQTGGTIPRLTKDMLPIPKAAFTDLVRNYRSHPGILATPSSLFYNDTLEPAASTVNSLLHCSLFSGRDIPVIFDDTRSPDEIEQDGGGWYNIGEAEKALQYAQTLLRERCAEHQIFIMSPFRAQVKVLRTKARNLGLSGINIGPLEAYQGLESRVVILCTTRTRDRFIDQDIAKGLGIIHESRRFNVAVTRAKEALIVLGNPAVLIQDENWASFIAFCQRNGAFLGKTDGLALPHSSKIKTSRLEKQLAYKKKVMEEAEISKVAKSLASINFGMSGEEAFYESGIAAESSVRNDSGHEA